jgi:sterol 14-demethylase
MALLLNTVLPALQTWPVAFLLLLLVPLLPVVHLLVNRPRLPKNVPSLLRGLPVFGSIGFYTERFDFIQRIKSMMPGKQFTFYYGRFPIIAMTGEAGRSVVFNTRGLDLKSGYVFRWE